MIAAGFGILVLVSRAGSQQLPKVITTGQLTMTGIDPPPGQPAVVLPKTVTTGELIMTGMDPPRPELSPAAVLPKAISTGELTMTGLD